MKRNSLIMAVLVFASFLLMLGAGIEDNEKCRAYVLMEAETGTVLESENGDEKLNIGYLSKLMSVLMIAEDIETGKFSKDDVLTASDSVTGTMGAVIWLEAGDTATVGELLEAVIVGNANDAMIVLAERSEQTLQKFTDRMNTEAFDMGLRDTAFYSPCGFYDSREFSTAHDLAVICSKLAKYDFLRGYFTTWRDCIRDGKVELVNENKLSRTYDQHQGFKAIHSDKSGYCIAEYGKSVKGVECIAVVLGAESEDGMYTFAKKLLKKGYLDYKVTSTMFPTEHIRPLQIRNGETSAAELMLEEQKGLVVPRSGKQIRTVVVLPDYACAPVKRGQRVGTAAFYQGDTLIYESPIVVQETVEKLSLPYILRKLMYRMTEK